MGNLSKEDKVARRLRGDAVEMVEEREKEVSVTVKGRQVVKPTRRSYPKRFPEGEGKLAAVYVVYFKSRSQSKLIAELAGVYYRPESKKFISYTYLEIEGYEIGSLNQNMSPGDLERKGKGNKEISLLYHNPDPIPGGEGEKTCRSGFVEWDPQDLH